MSQKQGLEPRFFDQAVELVRDHQPVLAELASRIEPGINELAETWTIAYRQTIADITLEPRGVPPAQFASVVHTWFGALQHGDVSQFYSGLLTWVRPIVFSGIAYPQLYKLVREFQRQTIPILLRNTQAGPELELLLAAFDDLFNGGTLLIGALYIDLLQESKIDDARMHILGRTTSGVTHRLSDTLVAVLGQLQMLVEQTRDAETRRELRHIQETAASGVQMLRYLRDFARSDADEPVAVGDVNRIMRNAAQVTRFVWRDQAEATGILIDLAFDFGDVPEVQVRAHQLERAFVSLIISAVEDLPQGGRIAVRSERQGDFVLASVISSGKGTNEPTQARVYDPFFTTQGLPHADTSLSLVAQIVAEHSGSLTVNSQPNQGMAYTISLPIATKSEMESSMPAKPMQGVSVLVIDNEPLVRTSFARLLGMYGHRVTPAESGPAGIAAFKKDKFDVVFTDLGMPGMSGWDVAQEIKKISPKTWVVLVTAWPIDQMAEELVSRGVDRVLPKPFEVDSLFKLMDEILVAFK